MSKSRPVALILVDDPNIMKIRDARFAVREARQKLDDAFEKAERLVAVALLP